MNFNAIEKLTLTSDEILSSYDSEELLENMLEMCGDSDAELLKAAEFETLDNLPENGLSERQKNQAGMGIAFLRSAFGKDSFEIAIKIK